MMQGNAHKNPYSQINYIIVFKLNPPFNVNGAFALSRESRPTFFSRTLLTASECFLFITLQSDTYLIFFHIHQIISVDEKTINFDFITHKSFNRLSSFLCFTCARVFFNPTNGWYVTILCLIYRFVLYKRYHRIHDLGQ